MKRPLLSLILISVFFLNAFSQKNGDYNFSVGLSGFSIMQLPRIFNQDPQKYIYDAINRGILKINDNQVSYRLSGNFTRKSVEFHSDCINCDLDNGSITDYGFKLGFEKNLNFSRIQPYFAFDVGYRYNHFKGLQNSIDLQRTISATSQLEYTKDGITVGPAVGIKINPIEQISIFVESALEYYYSYLRTQTIEQTPSALGAQSSGHKQEFLFNPVLIGIQIHLSNKN